MTVVPNVFPHFPNLRNLMLQGLFILLHPAYLDPSAWAAVELVWLRLNKTAPAVQIDLVPLYSVRHVFADFPSRAHIPPLFFHIHGRAELMLVDMGDTFSVHFSNAAGAVTRSILLPKDWLEDPDEFRYDIFTIPDTAHRIIAIMLDCSLWDAIVGLLPELPLLKTLNVGFKEELPALHAVFECPELENLIFSSSAGLRMTLFAEDVVEFTAGRLRGVCFPIEIRLVNIQLGFKTNDGAIVEEYNQFFSITCTLE